MPQLNAISILRKFHRCNEHTFIPLSGHDPLAYGAMRTWRRGFATSIRRLSQQQNIAARPTTLRCAELLELSRKDDVARSLENNEVTVQGFIRSVRKQKRFAFAEISDGSTIQSLQAILTPDQAAECAFLFFFFPCGGTIGD